MILHRSVNLIENISPCSFDTEAYGIIGKYFYARFTSLKSFEVAVRKSISGILINSPKPDPSAIILYSAGPSFFILTACALITYSNPLTLTSAKSRFKT